MTLSVEQREQLLCAKLAALSRDYAQFDSQPEVRGSLAVSRDGNRAAVLIEEGTAADLGAAFLWAARSEVEHVNIFVDSNADLIARMASYFAAPSTVWSVLGAIATPATPAAFNPAPTTPNVDPELLDILAQAGCEVVLEHGVYRGEIHGLEIARLVQWPTETGGDGEYHLEVGVGRFDRDATAAVHADTSPRELLESTVELIRRHRQGGALGHPIQYLARSRWLRSELIREPDRIGLAHLDVADMTSEATGIKDDHPCAALGITADGAPALVVCSTGVDVSLAARAGDTRAFHDPALELHIAVPERDATTVTHTLATLLSEPATVHPIPVDWIS